MTEASSSKNPTLSMEMFDTLAYGQVDPEQHQSFQELIAASRMLLLNQFFVHAREQLEDSQLTDYVYTPLSILRHWENTSATYTKELLLAPATGSWLAYTVNRLRSKTDESESRPLWVDAGYFSNIVMGLALRHGVGCTLPTPVVDGQIHIPGQGTARINHHKKYDMAVVSNTGGLLDISRERNGCLYDIHTSLDPAVPTPYWQPVHRIATKPQSSKRYPDLYTDMQLSILLDDADPYNNGRDPYKPSAQEISEWQTVLDGAWEILVQADPNVADQLRRGLKVIVPSKQNDPFEFYSSSDSTSIGSIRSSLPTNPLEAAEILVHEYCGHSALNTFLLAAPLKRLDDKQDTLYAPWRDDPRPSGGVLHGIYSFARVVDFYKAVQLAFEPNDAQFPLAQFEMTLWQSEVTSTANSLLDLWYGASVWSKQAHMHDPARNLLSKSFDHMARTRPFDLPNTESINELADLSRADHWALWNAYHRKVEPEAITRLAEEWLCGNKAKPVLDNMPLEHHVETNSDACKLHARAVLARHFLVNPETFIEMLDTCNDPMERADRALILGKSAIAHTLYNSILEQDALDIRAFVGQALSKRQPLALRNKFHTFELQKPHILLALQKAIIEKSGAPAKHTDLTNWIMGH
jgi:HEXXH motif-containing protein